MYILEDIWKNLKLEFYVIIGVLLFFILTGHREGAIFLQMDVGSMIAVVGMIWMVGAIFRLYEHIVFKIVSFVVGLFIYLFGHSLNEYGFFSAFIFVGAVALFIAYISHLFSPLAAKALFLGGIAFIWFGYSFQGCDRPTNPEKYHQPVKFINSEWDVNILYNDHKGVEQYKNIYRLKGTEESAYKATRNIVAQWKSTNKVCKALKEVQVNLDFDSCPEKLRENYCFTHSLDKTYPKVRRAEWTSFYDLIDIK